MDKLHLWTVCPVVSAERCLDPCQGKLKDGSQLHHANNQLAPASSTGPWTWQRPNPLAPRGPVSGKPKGCKGKGRAGFKGDMDLVLNLTPL